MSKLSKLFLCGLIGVASLSAFERVRADVPPPGLQECVGKAANDACDFGVCRDQTCSRLDYEHWNRDAGMGPPTITYACVLCVRGAGGNGAGGTTSAGTGGGGIAGGGESPAGNDTGFGCAAGGGELGAHGAALSFALLMGLWLGGRRRRSSR